MRKREAKPDAKKKETPRRTKARQILNGKYWALSRRCTRREYWLRPGGMVDRVLKYGIGAAVERCGVELLAWLAMSNHYHIVFYDEHARAPEFAEHLNKLVARALNVYWKRTENLWASGRPSLVELATEDDVMDKIVYALTNPVKDYLVTSVAHWPGINSWGYINGKSETVPRPRVFFRKKGSAFPSSAPSKVVLELSQPRFSIERGESRKDWMSQIRDGVLAREKQLLAAKPKDTKIVGRKAILAQSANSAPSPKKDDVKKLNPSIACKDKALRIQMCLRLRGFRAQYRKAFEDMQAGKDTVFPHGTYQYARLRIPVRVAPPPVAA